MEKGETFSKERMLARNRVVIEVVKSTQILVIFGKRRQNLPIIFGFDGAGGNQNMAIRFLA